LDIGSLLRDLTVQVPTNLHVGLAHHACGNYGKAIEFLRKNIEILQGDLVYDRFGLAAFPAVYSRTWLVFSLAEMGAFEEAILMGREEEEIADTADHPLSRLTAYLALGYLNLRTGEFPGAINKLDQCFRLCQTLGLAF
jgi:tetratricopeptide (TPR) repeat protein